MESIFHPDSYGYRSGRSAIDAVRTARQRCWRYDWVLDIDLKGYFDSIDWELLLKAVRKHTDCPWVLLYIERWLKAPVQMEDGSVVPRIAGTPQGGVIRSNTKSCWRSSRKAIRRCQNWGLTQPPGSAWGMS
jgi:retron-type reverse transcriptase